MNTRFDTKEVGDVDGSDTGITVIVEVRLCNVKLDAVFITCLLCPHHASRSYHHTYI
jgi:hypothetical protein